MTAIFKLINALAILGRCIIVRTLLGQNPSVLLKNFASSVISELVFSGSGLTRGIIFFQYKAVQHYKFIISDGLKTKNVDLIKAPIHDSIKDVANLSYILI